MGLYLLLRAESCIWLALEGYILWKYEHVYGWCADYYKYRRFGYAGDDDMFGSNAFGLSLNTIGGGETSFLNLTVELDDPDPFLLVS